MIRCGRRDSSESTSERTRMLLPCPECQTVYNAEPSVYKPGMAFQCVSCGAVVVVPTEIEAADAEPAEQSELDNPEPSGDTSHPSAEPEVETQVRLSKASRLIST